MIVNIAPPGQSAEKGCSVECGVTPAEAVVFAAWIAGPAYECTVLSARRGLAVLLSAEDCPLRATAATMRDIEVSLGGPLGDSGPAHCKLVPEAAQPENRTAMSLEWLLGVNMTRQPGRARGQREHLLPNGQDSVSSDVPERHRGRKPFLAMRQSLSRTRTQLRPVGTAHAVEHGLALLIHEPSEQLLRVPKNKRPCDYLGRCVKGTEAGDKLSAHQQQAEEGG